MQVNMHHIHSSSDDEVDFKDTSFHQDSSLQQVRCTYASVHTNIYIYICICVCACVCMYMHTCMQTYIHAYSNPLMGFLIYIFVYAFYHAPTTYYISKCAPTFYIVNLNLVKMYSVAVLVQAWRLMCSFEKLIDSMYSHNRWYVLKITIKSKHFF